MDPPFVHEADDGPVDHEKSSSVDQTLRYDESPDTLGKGTGEKPDDADGPSYPDHIRTIPLISSHHKSHEWSAEVRDAGCHGPDYGNVPVIVELGKLRVVVLEDAEGDREAFAIQSFSLAIAWGSVR